MEAAAEISWGGGAEVVEWLVASIQGSVSDHEVQEADVYEESYGDGGCCEGIREDDVGSRLVA